MSVYAHFEMLSNQQVRTWTNNLSIDCKASAKENIEVMCNN